MTTTLEHKKGLVRILETGRGRRRIEVHPAGGQRVRWKWETSYPLDLIRAVLEVKGPAFLCDEIRRDEDPAYTAGLLRHTVLAFLGGETLKEKRVLDFGCGSGASAMALARLFGPREIVGVERSQGLIRIARLRALHHGLDNVRFLRSPSDSELPPDLGVFDCVLLNAVFEHLLPEERRALPPLLWQTLAPGGVLLVNETPNRLFPLETHTTGLPLINYLPEPMALAAARRFSPRVNRGASWQSLLRRGVRGATAREIMGILRAGGARAALLPPTGPGIRNPGQIWFEAALERDMPFIKKLAVRLVRESIRLTGIGLSPYLCLAIRKEP